MKLCLPQLSILAVSGAAALFLAGAWSVADAQRGAAVSTSEEARAQLNRAKQQAKQAEARAEKLTEQARVAERTAERSAREAAAVAARIQQAEANLAAEEARLALISDQRRVLDARLADRQEPIVRLTAALQRLAQRPLALSALRPGSLKDTVYVRAVLQSAVPEIQQRTSSLRTQLAQSRSLEKRAAATLADLREQEQTLQSRRKTLAAMEMRQRRASRDASGVAVRENERALALAEQALDLGELVGKLDRAADLRSQLAALPGPVLRPPQPSASQVAADAAPQAEPTSSASPPGLQLPVNGRTIRGFGAGGSSGSLSEGLTLSPSAGAQVVAPARGRVAFAGPYRGFGRIVIIEHGNGWTSLVTGLGKTTVAVGDELVSGSPLGNAAASDLAITFELRRDGEPVNPLTYVE